MVSPQESKPMTQHKENTMQTIDVPALRKADQPDDSEHGASSRSESIAAVHGDPTIDGRESGNLLESSGPDNERGVSLRTDYEKLARTGLAAPPLNTEMADRENG